MGPGIGIDIYGMRDHVGKILWLVVIPNLRLSDTIGHVFLDLASKYKKMHKNFYCCLFFIPRYIDPVYG
jgi:hypothetical protein